MYLGYKPVKISRNLVTSAYQVVITSSGFPIPRRPFQAFFIVPATCFTVLVIFFGKVLCGGCGVAAVLALYAWVLCGEYAALVLVVLRKLEERGLYL